MGIPPSLFFGGRLGQQYGTARSDPTVDGNPLFSQAQPAPRIAHVPYKPTATSVGSDSSPVCPRPTCIMKRMVLGGNVHPLPDCKGHDFINLWDVVPMTYTMV
uniref:Uncharacterized protein n=1 Tax=Leersia perrieri TaxID=77586 RepID=A0A0D9XXM4_9ORYZ